MSDRTILDGIRLARPCPADWRDMQGDDRVRTCAGCDRQVYNLSALTLADAASFVAGRVEPTCVRLYRRADGTVLTSDCPAGVAGWRRSWVRRIAGLALVGAAVVITSTSSWIFRRDPFAPDPTTPGSEVVEWIERAMVRLGLREPRSYLFLGAVAIELETFESAGSEPPTKPQAPQNMGQQGDQEHDTTAP